jgi:hypothetical protein
MNKCRRGTKLPNVKPTQTPPEFCSQACKDSAGLAELKRLEAMDPDVMTAYQIERRDELSMRLGHKGERQ